MTTADFGWVGLLEPKERVLKDGRDIWGTEKIQTK